MPKDQHAPRAPGGAPPLFRTRITEFFGIRHPILAGGLMWLADAGYAAAVVNVGWMGFITSRSSATLDEFRAELSRCRVLTGGKPFGVNLSTSRHGAVRLMDYLEAALHAGVRLFETASRAPAGEVIAEIRRAGAVVIHKVPLLRHALAAERLGVAAVMLVGMECGGHPGANTDVPAMGPAVCFVDRVEPIGAIMDRLVAEAAACQVRLEELLASAEQPNPRFGYASELTAVPAAGAGTA